MRASLRFLYDSLVASREQNLALREHEVHGSSVSVALRERPVVRFMLPLPKLFPRQMEVSGPCAQHGAEKDAGADSRPTAPASSEGVNNDYTDLLLSFNLILLVYVLLEVKALRDFWRQQDGEGG
jgi:hypothetical protein